jgi:hypothetical protein
MLGHQRYSKPSHFAALMSVAQAAKTAGVYSPYTKQPPRVAQMAPPPPAKAAKAAIIHMQDLPLWGNINTDRQPTRLLFGDGDDGCFFDPGYLIALPFTIFDQYFFSIDNYMKWLEAEDFTFENDYMYEIQLYAMATGEMVLPTMCKQALKEGNLDMAVSISRKETLRSVLTRIGVYKLVNSDDELATKLVSFMRTHDIESFAYIGANTRINTQEYGQALTVEAHRQMHATQQLATSLMQETVLHAMS